MWRVDIRVEGVGGMCVRCVLWWVMRGLVWSARLVRGDAVNRVNDGNAQEGVSLGAPGGA